MGVALATGLSRWIFNPGHFVTSPLRREGAAPTKNPVLWERRPGAMRLGLWTFAALQTQSSTWPLMHTTLWPPTHTWPLASRCRCTWPARPRQAPWAAW